MQRPRDIFGTKRNKNNNADNFICSRKKTVLFPKLKSDVHRTVLYIYI